MIHVIQMIYQWAIILKTQTAKVELIRNWQTVKQIKNWLLCINTSLSPIIPSDCLCSITSLLLDRCFSIVGKFVGTVERMTTLSVGVLHLQRKISATVEQSNAWLHYQWGVPDSQRKFSATVGRSNPWTLPSSGTHSGLPQLFTHKNKNTFIAVIFTLSNYLASYIVLLFIAHWVFLVPTNRYHTWYLKWLSFTKSINIYVPASYKH